MLAVSRRGVLRAGLLGSVAVWGGGLLACGSDRGVASAASGNRVAISSAGEEILRSVTPVVLGGMIPATGDARERIIDDGIASLDDYVAHLSPWLQREVRDVFGMLDLWPVRLLLTGDSRPWREKPLQSVDSFLRSARESRLLLLRRVYSFLQSMVVLSFFDQPSAWQAVGYPGPLAAPPTVLQETR